MVLVRKGRTIMLKTVFAAGVATLALTLAGCNQSNTPAQTSSSSPAPGSRNETASATKDAVAGGVGKLNAELTSSTKGFVQAAAMGDMYEVEAGKIALMRSHSDDVKKFAQMMIDGHTKTTKNLQAAIMHSGATFTLPAAFDSRHQGLIDDLKGAKDQDFDTRYIAQQENAHDEALTLMRGYAKDGDNPDVKMFAEMTVPAIQMHIDMIKTVEDAHKGKQRRAENRPREQRAAR
jgi:putative membrane protein